MVDRNGDGFIDASDLSQVGRMALQKTQVMSSRVPTPTDPYGLSSFHIISSFSPLNWPELGGIWGNKSSINSIMPGLYGWRRSSRLGLRQQKGEKGNQGKRWGHCCDQFGIFVYTQLNCSANYCFLVLFFWARAMSESTFALSVCDSTIVITSKKLFARSVMKSEVVNGNRYVWKCGGYCTQMGNFHGEHSKYCKQQFFGYPIYKSEWMLRGFGATHVAAPSPIPGVCRESLAEVSQSERIGWEQFLKLMQSPKVLGCTWSPEISPEYFPKWGSWWGMRQLFVSEFLFECNRRLQRKTFRKLV